jgi:hypothetical protein
MVYTEKQSMRQYWWVLLITAASMVMMFTLWLAEEDPTKKQELLTALLIVVGLEGGILALIFSMNLRTKVDNKGITYSFKPFLREKNLKWADLDKVWVRKYKPIAEYGGWGFRVAWFKKTGKAYSVWGNYGLQLHLKSGKKILIGTQKKDELVTFLKRLKEKHEIKVIEDEQLKLHG